MAEEMIIRQAKPEDYASYRVMEEKIWNGTGIDIIKEEMFLAWIDVFPEGFMLALKDNEVVGQLYGQICDFNPLNKSDQRNLNTMTDNMWTIRTHNPRGNCCYTFSVTATNGQAAKMLNEYYVKLTEDLNKEYYAGVVRMSGLTRYAEQAGVDTLSFSFVERYLKAVSDTIRRKRKGDKKVFDPVVSPLLFIRSHSFAEPWVIRDFFPFPGTQSWGCVIWHKNEKYKRDN